MKLETLAVHAGDRKKPGDYIPVTTPIYGASSYIYERLEDLDRVFADEKQGQSYARYGSPTTNALEEQVAALEGGEFALASASGMASLHLALLAALTDRRKSIVAANVLFGQSMTLMMNLLEPTGVAIQFADPCDLKAFEAAVAQAKPACVLVETISNPLMRVPAIDKIAEIARRHGALTVVDATFTTPVLTRPIAQGADFVIHSSTKYLAGHGDVLGGLLITRNEFRQVVQSLSRTMGSTLGPFEAYLTMRGVKTLPLRIERQSQNACRVAAALQGHPRVEKVNFPGDPAHPDAETVRRLFPKNLFGGMVSFSIKDAGREEVFRFNDALELVIRATSLGDVHTLISYPAITSHRELSPKHRQKLGIADNLLRLSVGIEAAEDIIADLEQALDSA
jgi:cystathionine gamma-synthase